jgi:hypothetical protein
MSYFNPSVVAYERGANSISIFATTDFNLILILSIFIYTLCYHTWEFFYK